jgi:probable F420-dependent oxidoreductase
MTDRGRPFKIGVFIPHFERPWSGEMIRWREMLAMAQRAEEIGFDSVWLPDHLLYRFPGVNSQGVWDVWSLLAALAGSTQRVEIAPLVACTSFRNPALIAKMADTIDEISGGRLILGLGAGWHKPEYEAFGFPFDHRVSRFEEAIQIIHGLLRNGQIDFEGTYYSARDCELRPRGPRAQGPPILVGSNSPRMMGIMAKYADAWNSDRRNDVDELLAIEARVDAACIESGRDPASLERVVGIQADLLDEQREAHTPRQYVKRFWPHGGSAEQIAEAIRDYTRAKVDHLIVWIDPVSIDGVEAFAPVLEILDRGN